MEKINLLRAITHRLNNTAVKDLPPICNFLASSILNCADSFQLVSGPATGKFDDLALQVHKLKARLSSLLQDRSAEGRFTAVILVKATIEAGGRDVLGSCEPWLRGLLAILSKPDPGPTKKLCILTITRIFTLTHQYPGLVREITTPLLPAFVTSCLHLGGLHTSRDKSSPSRPNKYLETILECIHHLLPAHPTTFRPFASIIHGGLTRFIGGQSGSDKITHLSQAVFVTLHFCASKNTAGDEWLKAFKAVVASIHGIADQILRAILEDWEPAEVVQLKATTQMRFDEAPSGNDGNPLGLAPWEGVYQGSRVLASLMHLVKAFLHGRTSQSVDVPLGVIVDMTARLLYVRVPLSGTENYTSARFNPEVGRPEREELLAVLPDIHRSTLDMLSCLVETLQLSMLPASQEILDQCLWVFGTEHFAEATRVATYELLGKIVRLLGPSITTESFKPLAGVLDSCCRDVSLTDLDHKMAANSKPDSNAKTAINGHADSILESISERREKPEREGSHVAVAASWLLCQILEHVPAQSTPSSCRAQIDRIAIYSDHKETMLASVLNPPPKKADEPATPSILPFLARSAGDDIEIEALLRPRIPAVGGYGLRQGLEVEVEDKMENSKHAMQEDINGTGSETPAEKGFDQSAVQNDLLDRLEDSIGDTPVSVSNAESAPSAPSYPPRAGLGPQAQMHDSIEAAHQGVKRILENGSSDREESNKRTRNDGRHFELEQTATLHETPTQFPAATLAIVEPDPVMSLNQEADAHTRDKGKDSVATIFPGSEAKPTLWNEISDGDDDESDLEMPQIYLKTSSEEEDEEDEEDEMP